MAATTAAVFLMACFCCRTRRLGGNGIGFVAFMGPPRRKRMKTLPKMAPSNASTGISGGYRSPATIAASIFFSTSLPARSALMDRWSSSATRRAFADLGTSLESFLVKYADALEAGTYVASDEDICAADRLAYRDAEQQQRLAWTPRKPTARKKTRKMEPAKSEEAVAFFRGFRRHEAVAARRYK